MRFRWLDFDSECRPISYLGSDFTTADLTAIAAGYCDEDEIECWVQTKRAGSAKAMLRRFREVWDEADGVTGHNIRRHDLPMLNGAMLEVGLPTLTPKMTCDTYGDLKKKSGISGSQENLSSMLGLSAPKVGMSTTSWREANRLTPAGIESTKNRVISDVVQHKQLRAALIERDMLRQPKVWRA